MYPSSYGRNSLVSRPRGFLTGGFSGLTSGSLFNSGRSLGGQRRYDNCYDCYEDYNGGHVCGSCAEREYHTSAALQLDQYGCTCAHCDYCEDYGYSGYNLHSRNQLQGSNMAGLLMPGYGSGSGLTRRRRGYSMGGLGGLGSLGGLGGFGGFGRRGTSFGMGNHRCP